MKILDWHDVALIAGVLLTAFGISFGLTAWVRHHALAHQILDVPNQRSSHDVPIPRGGGLAVAAVVLGGVGLGFWAHLLPAFFTIAILGGGALIAAVGWADDRRARAAVLRIAVHFVAAAWAMYWLGGLPTLRLADTSLTLGLWGLPVGILAIVWSTNLYNFMDGIDGLAAGEAVSLGLIAGLFLLLTGQAGLALVAFLVAGASGGFLAWNWPPAKIFMGDVGSGLLGFVFAVLALASENTGGLTLLWWIVLYLSFVFDATCTLIRRASRGARLQVAHRNHAYQRAVATAWSHAEVTTAILVGNLLLGGLVFWGLAHPRFAWLAVLLAIALAAGAYIGVEIVRPMERDVASA